MKKKVLLVIVITLIVASGIFLYNYAYNKGYNEGELYGYDNGYNNGYEDAGKYFIKNINTNTNLNRTSNTYLTTDTAPAGTVWTTPSGEKYHEPWCRYIEGRHDLTYFYTESDAANAGYSPCSVCH